MVPVLLVLLVLPVVVVVILRYVGVLYFCRPLFDVRWLTMVLFLDVRLLTFLGARVGTGRLVFFSDRR